MKDPHAEAAGEIAKTVGKVTDAAREFGKFLAPIVRRPLEDTVGIFADKMAYMRWERQLRLMQRARYFMLEQGIEEPTRPVPLNYAIPLLQAASMEEEDTLQDIWARLLVNAMDADSGIEIRRAFIGILENLSPLDVLILSKLSTGSRKAPTSLYVGSYLPDNLVEETPPTDETVHPTLQKNVEISLLNLERLGCVSLSYSGFLNPQLGVLISVLGAALVEACTLRKKD